jgi:hypothetical protein
MVCDNESQLEWMVHEAPHSNNPPKAFAIVMIGVTETDMSVVELSCV